jgi:hypothetical protein
MKMLIAVLPLLLLVSCAPEEIQLKPEGSTVVVGLTTGRKLRGELLALNDTVLVCRTDSVCVVAADSLLSVDIDEGNVRRWQVPVFLLQVIPSLVVVSAVDEKWIGAGALGVTALTWTLFEISTPKVDFTRPFTSGDREAIRLHSHFPEGLTQGQIDTLRRLTPPPKPN